MALSNQEISGLLQLQSSGLIAKEIAERQTEAIRKAYNYLSASDDHNIIYIADEVGLGKTYIALGIAMLRRHFSHSPSTHRDLVLVPKANLQQKWQREAKSFVQNNYVGPHQSFFNNLFQHDMVFNRLEPIERETPMSVFRMTSFSALLSGRSGREKNSIYWKALSQLNNDEWAKSVLDSAWSQGFFNNDKAMVLRGLVAYLLNAVTGKIDTLIIDEAHNYRHGLDHNPSIRNYATTYFLGAIEDKELLETFPDLVERVHFPLAEKVICLSATPKDRHLHEIGKQLDCFISEHPLKGIDDGEFLGRLKTILFRGNMSYEIGGEKVSRHSCREEHRKGNVVKIENAEMLDIPDSFTGAFWQLIQYHSIKHLRAKGNASFEMGMLAGFETYQLDAQKNLSLSEDIEEISDDDTQSKEYEQISTRSITESEDKQVIGQLVGDFKKKFNELPPHPKQTPLEEELLRQMKRQEKALVFVRRVHTATELSERLLRRFEGHIAGLLNFQKGFRQFNSQGVKDILAEFDIRDRRDPLEKFFKEKLISRMIFDWFQEMEEDEQIEYCFFCYKHNETLKKDINRLIERERLHISSDFKQEFQDMNRAWKKSRDEETDDPEGEETELGQNYFFNDYFRKGRPGFRFRRKMSRKKLFDLPDDLLTDEQSFLSLFLKKECPDELENWKSRTNYQPDDLNLLRIILQGIFRNGSGLLPAFVADAANGDFVKDLTLLLKKGSPFEFVVDEVRTVLRDFDLLAFTNFNNRDAEKLKVFFHQLSPVIGRTGQTGGDRSRLAAQFRTPGFPYVLIATDIFREGEDLHTYCQNVYHYGIAWNPSDMEQRTGRIDRINSMSYRRLTEAADGNIFYNKVHVFYPYLKRSVEVNQVIHLFTLINHFMETFNEIDQTTVRDSKVDLDVQVGEEIPKPVIPKRGRFELEDFKDWI